MTTLEQILFEQPKFHKGEPEIKGTLSIEDSYLPNTSAEQLANGIMVNYGVRPDVARFIGENVSRESRTLETGAGISTLVFALKRSNHIAITPNTSEVSRIKEYAAAKAIELDTVTFITQQSEAYLPQCDVEGLDLVLIDGKHAFPWPMIDWFYTADRLRGGGLMLLDDGQLISVGILKDFMMEDPRWEFLRAFGDRTFVFRKIARIVHDIAWHMQPYIMSRINDGTREWSKTLGGNY